jgi:hypothetical protein
MILTYTRTIRASRAIVFSCLEKNWLRREWEEGFVEQVPLTPLNPADPVGFRFIQRNRAGGRLVDYEGMVTAYDNPALLGVRVGDRHFSIHVTYRVAVEGRDTRLDYQAEVTYLSLLGRLMAPLAGLMLRRIVGRQLPRLQALAERMA